MYLSNETLKQLKKLVVNDEKEDTVIIDRLIKNGEKVFYDKKNKNFDSEFNIEDKSVIYDKLLTDWEIRPESVIQTSPVIQTTNILLWIIIWIIMIIVIVILIIIMIIIMIIIIIVINNNNNSNK